MGRFANFVRCIDRFSKTRFVWYNGQEAYSTIFGGVISLLIIAIFIAISMNQLVKMG